MSLIFNRSEQTQVQDRIIKSNAFTRRAISQNLCTSYNNSYNVFLRGRQSHKTIKRMILFNIFCTLWFYLPVVMRGQLRMCILQWCGGCISGQSKMLSIFDNNTSGGFDFPKNLNRGTIHQGIIDIQAKGIQKRQKKPNPLHCGFHSPDSSGDFSRSDTKMQVGTRKRRSLKIKGLQVQKVTRQF